MTDYMLMARVLAAAKNGTLHERTEWERQKAAEAFSKFAGELASSVAHAKAMRHLAGYGGGTD